MGISNYYDSNNTLQSLRVEDRDGTKVIHIADDYSIDSSDLNKELVYYSKYLFKTSGGTWKEKPTDDSDVINLDTDGINCLLYETALLAAQELAAEGVAVDVKFFQEKVEEAYKQYEKNHKSLEFKRQNNYYRPTNMRRR